MKPTKFSSVVLATALFISAQIAHAYTAIAFSTKNPRRTTFIATGYDAQQKADDAAIAGCNSILTSQNIKGIECDGLERQPSPGYGAIACQIIKCYFGYASNELAAREQALSTCKGDAFYNEHARNQCAVGLPKANNPTEIAGVWRDSGPQQQRGQSPSSQDRTQTSRQPSLTTSAAIYGLQVGRTNISSIKPCEGKQLPRGQDYCWNTHRQVGDDRAKEFVTAQDMNRYDIVINSDMFDVGSFYTNPILGTFSWVEAWVARDGTLQRLRFFTGFAANNKVLETLTEKFGQPSSVGKVDWFDSVTKQPLMQSRTTEWKSGGIYVLFAEKADISPDNPKADRGSVEISLQELNDRLVAFEKRKRGNTRGM